MKLELTLTKTEIIAKFASGLGVDPSNVVLNVVDDAFAKTAPADTETALITARGFFDWYLKSHGISVKDAAKLCGVSKPTISRCKNPSHTVQKRVFDGIVAGLGMDKDAARKWAKEIRKAKRK